MQLLLQEENLLIVAGVAGAIGILLIVLLTTAVALVLRKRMKGLYCFIMPLIKHNISILILSNIRRSTL